MGAVISSSFLHSSTYSRALGYSDPAVSTMLVELVKDGYIETTKSPEHARKRLVTITSKGNEVVAQGRHLLDSHFDQLMLIADIDAHHYRELTERLHQALIAKMQVVLLGNCPGAPTPQKEEANHPFNHTDR